jgi:type I restriction enzyme S subunit
MIDGLKPYPENQPAHPWLGAVPASWTLTTLGAVTTRRSARNRPDLPLMSVLREKGVVPRSSLAEDENHNFIPDDLSNYRVAFQGDLVVNKMKAWQGSVGIAPCDGIVSPAYFVFELFGITQPFAHRLFRSKPYVAFFGQSSDGVRIGQWDLSIDRMKRIPVPVPPPVEQAGIVRFLEAVDRKVNRFIRAKRRLIEVLTEQKQAIITHAVTKGLNPSAPLKPSGIDWLGDVPGHWDVQRCVRLFRERVERGREGLPILSVSLNTGVTVSGDVDEDGRPRRLIQDVAQYKYTAKGDIAYNTMRMWQGAVGVVPTDGLVSPAYVVAVPRVRLSADFYGLLFRTERCLQEFNRQSRGIVTDRNRLYWDEFKQVSLPLPPLDEQTAIVEWIVEQTREIERSIDLIRREIDLIREYRTRLVADVVTGKVDVRAAAATIPDEAAAPDPGEGAGPDDPATDDDAADADLEPALDGAETEREDEA